MSSKIFQLQSKASAHDAEQVQHIARFLGDQGFDCKDLDDLVYGLAESICNGYRDEVGPATAQRLAQAEFNAANELNQMSMDQQLLVLRSSSESSKSFLDMLEAHLKLKIPQELVAC